MKKIAEHDKIWREIRVNRSNIENLTEKMRYMEEQETNRLREKLREIEDRNKETIKKGKEGEGE